MHHAIFKFESNLPAVTHTHKKNFRQTSANVFTWPYCCIRVLDQKQFGLHISSWSLIFGPNLISTNSPQLTKMFFKTPSLFMVWFGWFQQKIHFDQFFMQDFDGQKRAETYFELIITASSVSNKLIYFWTIYLAKICYVWLDYRFHCWLLPSNVFRHSCLVGCWFSFGRTG